MWKIILLATTSQKVNRQRMQPVFPHRLARNASWDPSTSHPSFLDLHGKSPKGYSSDDSTYASGSDVRSEFPFDPKWTAVHGDARRTAFHTVLVSPRYDRYKNWSNYKRIPHIQEL